MRNLYNLTSPHDDFTGNQEAYLSIAGHGTEVLMTVLVCQFGRSELRSLTSLIQILKMLKF